MAVLNVNLASSNAYSSILKSMNNVPEITICNNLDACGCCGNNPC